MSRSFQAQFVAALKNQAGVSKSSNNPRKCLRESQIRKSERNVENIINTLKNVFINLFSPDLDGNHLYNLASGCPLPGDITESLLSVTARGTSLWNTFFKRLRQSQEDKELFFDQVKRIEWKGFLSLNKKVKVSSKGKSKDVAVQRDILGLLAAKSHQQNAAINIDCALCYPLAPVPLSMATAGGARRKTAKSKLFDATLSSITNGDREPSDVDTENKVYILDLAAAIRSTVAIPDTFRDLSLQILSQLPKNYETIYVACDTYQEKSIKNSKGSVRGVSDKMVI